MKRVLFRVDAGSGIGLGHLVRCLALAHALQQLGLECSFFTSSKVEARVQSHGGIFTPLGAFKVGGALDLEQTIGLAHQHNCRAVIVDSYDTDANYLARLRDEHFFVVMIDDLAAFPFPCQLVVNGSIYAQDKLYGSASGDTEFLLGPQYILLRPEFWNIEPKPLREQVENILVLLGGFDPLDLMPRLLGALDTLKGPLRITAIVGLFFENRSEIEAVARGMEHAIELEFNPPDVRDLILDADMAISAGGQTIHELLACGCPTVALPIAENQLPNVQAWAERGAVLAVADTLAMMQAKAVNRVMGAIQTLHQSPQLRAELRENGRRWIDGQGAVRVAKKIDSAVWWV